MKRHAESGFVRRFLGSGVWKIVCRRCLKNIQVTVTAGIHPQRVTDADRLRAMILEHFGPVPWAPDWESLRNKVFSHRSPGDTFNDFNVGGDPDGKSKWGMPIGECAAQRGRRPWPALYRLAPAGKKPGGLPVKCKDRGRQQRSNKQFESLRQLVFLF